MENLDIKYIIFGEEKGELGTQHLQGYLVLHWQKTLNATKTFIGINSIHLEVAKGNSSHNKEYCSKGEQTHDEWESLGTQGPNYGLNAVIHEKGTRPLTQKEKGEEGKKYWEQLIVDSEKGDFSKIREEDPKLYFHHLRTIQYHRTNAAQKPASLVNLDNIWIWGPTGTGKSLSVEVKYPNAYKKMQNKWWDGYNDEEEVFIDDLDKKKAIDFMGALLKNWADHGAFLAECKGGNTRYIRPKRIIVTCNWSPNDIWEEQEMLQPILRRFRLREQPPGQVERLLGKLAEQRMITALGRASPEVTTTI